MYFIAINNIFQKIPVELPKPPSPKEKHQSLLYDIGGGWEMKKLSENLQPLNKKETKQKITRKGG